MLAEVGKERGGVKETNAIPLILLILPGFVNSKPDLMARTDGQVKVTSPPPNGG